MNSKKGLSMPMEIIIGVVVLVVIALAVIMFTSGSVSRTGTSTNKTQTAASSGMDCETQVLVACQKTANPSVTCSATTCPACGTGTVRTCDL